MNTDTKIETAQLLHDLIMGKDDAVELYNTKEAAQYIGVPHGELVIAFFRQKKRPTAYVISDASDIYFDKKGVDALCRLLRPKKKGASNGNH